MEKPRRILLVDESKKDVELTLMALADDNLANEVDVVHDGAQALDYLHRRGSFESREQTNPAVILLDLRLPKVDGLDVLKEIRSDAQLKWIPVVALTSSREERDLIEGYNSGANAYVVKPVEFRPFVAAIKSLATFWVSINESPPGSARK